MEENYRKYAELIIKRCLSIKAGQPLLISTPIEPIEYIRVLTDVALENGVRDIYYDYNDGYIKHSHLKYLTNNELETNILFNKQIFDEYTKKGAAVLMLCGGNPDIMKDIDNETLAFNAKLSNKSRKLFRSLQLTYEVPWCIASVATIDHAKKVFPNSNNPLENLWNAIFKMCLIDKDDPIKEWDNKIKNNQTRVNILNNLNIKKLKYKNKLGTDFEIRLNNNIWCGANTKGSDGRNLIVNMPTEEIFTSPDKDTMNGIVYSSKPLVYNGTIINNFWIKFKDGKVIDFDSESGKDVLSTIFKINGGNKLGEVALVDVTSPISKSNILFYETLYDENASCHLALGEGFTECSKDKDPEWLNKSDTHVDFMIGTDDLLIEAQTDNGIVIIMKDGKFVI